MSKDVEDAMQLLALLFVLVAGTWLIEQHRLPDPCQYMMAAWNVKMGTQYLVEEK